MIPRQLIRSVAVCLGTFGVGLAILLLVAGDRGSGPRRGIRIGTVDEAEAAAARNAVPLLPGVPNLQELTGPRYHRYESVELPRPGGGTDTFRYLAYHLACERVLPDRRRAENVVFSLYPSPATREEAILLAREEAKPIALITAGAASADRVVSAEGAGEEDWVRTLSEGVRIYSLAEGRRADLEAVDLVCYAAERRVVSKGPISIRAEEYTIRGRGLSGDAGLGTFSVEKDVEILLPTAALLGPETQEEEPTVTSIRCGGPLLVTRLGSSDPNGRTPTRVSFEDEVRLVQGEGSAAGTTTLDARSVVLVLSVLTRRQAEAGEEAARVESLVADGDVRFQRGDETSSKSSRMTLERIATGDRLTFLGPAEFRHRGVLPMPGADETATAEPGEIRVTAGGEIVLVRNEGENALRASFDGGVTADRLTALGENLLHLEARTLSLASDPKLGEELVASGDASFRAPTAQGTADTITWRAERDAGKTTRLDGRPSVDVQGGAGTNPFALPVAGGGDAQDDKTKPVLHLESEKSLVLREEGDLTTFTLNGPALVTRSLDGVEQLRVRADSVVATLSGPVLQALVAEGHVSADGAAQEIAKGILHADADRFDFDATRGTAVITGSPARIHIAETDREANEITAPTLVFHAADGKVQADGGVDARVFLEEEDGKKVRPVSLTCRSLEVIPKPEVPGEPPPADPSGRIERLTATGDVVLHAMEWNGFGDLLVVTTVGKQDIHLSGRPAIVTRIQNLAGGEFEDRFTADGFTLGLRDEKIRSFDSPTGGEFTLYRAFRADGPDVFGAGGGDAGKRTLERFSGHSNGRMNLDEEEGVARMTGGARVEQYAGVPGRLDRLAAFTADLLVAYFDKREGDGALLLHRAEGRGNVTGEGEGDSWKAFADGFSVDFLNHQTMVWGKPARVIVNGEEQTVVRAVYNYERDEWSEFFRAAGK